MLSDPNVNRGSHEEKGKEGETPDLASVVARPRLVATRKVVRPQRSPPSQMIYHGFDISP